jgi:exopolysaccharide biosynthesis polyprenyl glycosylphosphotransferase
MTLEMHRSGLVFGRSSVSGTRLRYLSLTALVVDTTAITLAIVLSVAARQHLGVFEAPVVVWDTIVVVGPFMMGGWLALITLVGGYRGDVFGAGTDEFKRVLTASLLAAGLVGVGCYVAQFPLSRGFFLIAFGVGAPALIVGRWLLRRTLHAARRRGALAQRVVIAGSPSHVDEIAAVLRRESWLGYQVIGALTPGPGGASETVAGIQVFGSCDDVIVMVEEAQADVIFFAGGALGSASDLRRIVWELEGKSVQVVIAPGVTDVSGERIKVRPVGGLPLMHIDPPTWIDASRWGKRAFDLVGAAAILVLLSPLLIAVAVVVRLNDGGPVLFRQTRTGRHGEEFACLKFRSMVVDAEARLARLQTEQGHQQGLFKMKDDPRMTKPGRWLRRFSIDELPQLINVLRGEMSLVGPRPPLPREVESYEADTTRRLRVRPGMTGLWQVSGRSDLSWEEAVRLDLYYVDNWSMVQDLYILVRTVRAVFGRSGAY